MHINTYLMHAVTHMHAGAEGANAGIVDKLVQRDPVSDVPVVHASSLKGSLRELFEVMIYPEKGEKDERVSAIFGPVGDELGSRTPGYAFFGADLLSLPVRSNMQPFFNATSPETLAQFVRVSTALLHPKADFWANLLKPLILMTPEEGKPVYFAAKALDGIAVDDYHYQPVVGKDVTITNEIRGLLGNDIMLFHHNDFKDICRKLPVVARNKLVNSESKNLWYEEIVPRESRFVFHVGRKEPKDLLEEGLSKDTIGHMLQVGGNASVGYGYCKLTLLN